MILRNSLPPYRRITVPNHKSLAKGTLRQIVKDAGLTIEEFKNLL
jgi:predicted RNA binding protein YcfA (HicA-like mRNA interferase family)